MATVTETIRESAPRSNFPSTILKMNNVTAPNTAQLKYIAQYNAAAADGDWTTCKEILEKAKADASAGDLSGCKITSEGFNTLVDEIKAVELYYNSEMDNYFAELTAYVDKCGQESLGLDDSTSSTKTSYSSEKIDSLLAAITTITEVTVLASAWTADSSGRYTQTCTVENITAESYPDWYLKGSPTADEYESFCYISSMETNDGSVTFTCASDVPTHDLTIMIKGY